MYTDRRMFTAGRTMLQIYKDNAFLLDQCIRIYTAQRMFTQYLSYYKKRTVCKQTQTSVTTFVDKKVHRLSSNSVHFLVLDQVPVLSNSVMRCRHFMCFHLSCLFKREKKVTIFFKSLSNTDIFPRPVLFFRIFYLFCLKSTLG